MEAFVKLTILGYRAEQVDGAQQLASGCFVSPAGPDCRTVHLRQTSSR